MPSFPLPSSFKTPAAFRAHLRTVAPAIDLDDEVLGADGPLGAPLELGDVTLRNRFCVHPMEGWDGNRDGTPSPDTLRRWRRFGRSGCKLVWGGEAWAVTPEGRANPNQLHRNPALDPVPGLRALREELIAGHREVGEDPDELYVGLQLTHSGRFCNPDGEKTPRIAFRHPLLDPRVGVTRDDAMLSDDELLAIADAYVDAARAADAAGFDFVDVKCCHGYLLHELLAARTRPGRFGGSFENRTAIFRRIVTGIRDACPDLGVALRVSIADLGPFAPDADGVGAPVDLSGLLPYVHGFGVDADDPTKSDLTEPLAFLDLARDFGVRLVNLSLSSPYWCPHVQRPAAWPPSDGYLPPGDPLEAVARHIEVTRAVKAARPDLWLVGSGYSYLQEYLPHVAQHEVRGGHVDLIGLGRSMLAYPELPLDVLRGRALDKRRICRTFSDCTTGPRQGLQSGCYPLDEHYRSRDEAKTIRDLRRRRFDATGGGAATGDVPPEDR